MEFFRRAIRQIRSQLGILTTSQRMVVILLLVVMCGAILWMIKYAGEREMVPLLNQSLEENVLQSIVNKLDGWEQEYEVKGDRILVPKADQKKLIARLAFAGALPEDTSISWALMMEESDIWTPPGVREDRNLIIKQTELARMIAQFPGVESAQVIISPAKDRRLNNVQPAASASVSVTTSSGAATKDRLASTIAGFVSGANRNLKREDVRVAINGKLVSIPDADEEMTLNYWNLKVKCEQIFRNKILSILEVPNALVVVDVIPQDTDTIKKSRTYDENKSVSLIKEKTNKEVSSTKNNPSREPGFESNGSAAQVASGNGENETTEESTTIYDSFPTVVDEETRILPVGVKDITATVRMPESYYENLAKKRAQEGTEPTAADIQAVIDAELPKVKNSVMAAIHQVTPEEEAQVVVNTYWDQGSLVASASDVEAAGEREAAGSVSGVARRYGKQIAVSALALLSLFMALMMVRRAAGPVEMEEEEAAALMMHGKKPMDALSVEESNLAEGAEGGLLAGVELDDEAVRSQQMLAQIKDMVTESPESAAALVSKWIGGAE